jgi:hypothetical protein
MLNSHVNDWLRWKYAEKVSQHEPDCFSGIQETTRLLRNPKVAYPLHQSVTLLTVFL